MSLNLIHAVYKSVILTLCLFFAFTTGFGAYAASNVPKPTEPYIEIIDESALAIVNPNTPFTVLGTGYAWSEGPVWNEQDDMLIFSDVPTNTLYQYKKGQGVSVYLSPSGATKLNEYDSSQGGNGLLINNKGQLVIMQHGDRRVALMDAPLNAPAAKFTSLVSTFQQKRLNSPNDGVFHSNGDLYFTDPPYGLKGGAKSAHKELSFHGIYRLKTNGEIMLEDDSVLFPNGIVLSNDESFAIVASSDAKNAKWYKYDIQENGSLANKQIFYDASALVGKDNERGLPDGMVVHSKGYIFATGPGGVFIFTETGKLLAKIRTGKATANCTLSTDERTLFMTAHDTLMSIALE
jgi:gluconolactonase